MTRSTRTLLIDANVLAAPVTRTLLLIGVEAVDSIVRWSHRAEDEADRNMRRRAMSVTEIRTTIGESDLSPTGKRPSKYLATRDDDRQILADAVAADAVADAAYIMTTGVDDFGEADLISEKIAAVNPIGSGRGDAPRRHTSALAQLVANSELPSQNHRAAARSDWSHASTPPRAVRVRLPGRGAGDDG